MLIQKNNVTPMSRFNPNSFSVLHTVFIGKMRIHSFREKMEFYTWN